jgi:hypothetical protein
MGRGLGNSQIHSQPERFQMPPRFDDRLHISYQQNNPPINRDSARHLLQLHPIKPNKARQKHLPCFGSFRGLLSAVHGHYADTCRAGRASTFGIIDCHRRAKQNPHGVPAHPQQWLGCHSPAAKHVGCGQYRLLDQENFGDGIEVRRRFTPEG